MNMNRPKIKICSVLMVMVVIVSGIVTVKVERINDMIVVMTMWVSIVAKGPISGTVRSDKSDLAYNRVVLEATSSSVNTTNFLSWLKVNNRLVTAISPIQLTIDL